MIEHFLNRFIARRVHRDRTILFGFLLFDLEPIAGLQMANLTEANRQ